MAASSGDSEQRHPLHGQTQNNHSRRRLRHHPDRSDISICITDSQTLLPDPSIPVVIPRSTCTAVSSSVEEDWLGLHITPDQWSSFASDANNEIDEWRSKAQKVQRYTWRCGLLSATTAAAALPLLLNWTFHYLPKDASLGVWYRICALVTSSLFVLSLFATAIVVYRGASIERLARSDLISILDWYSDEMEDCGNLSFELVRYRATAGIVSDQPASDPATDIGGDKGNDRESGNDHESDDIIEHEDGTSPSPSPSLSWVPVSHYVSHYFIKIVVKEFRDEVIRQETRLSLTDPKNSSTGAAYCTEPFSGENAALKEPLLKGAKNDA